MHWDELRMAGRRPRVDKGIIRVVGIIESSCREQGHVLAGPTFAPISNESPFLVWGTEYDGNGKEGQEDNTGER